jgi:hypothetical protein
LRILYQLTPIQEEAMPEIACAPSVMSNPELNLLASVRFTVNNRGFITLYFITLSIMVGLDIIIIRQLRGLLSTVPKGQFFVAGNVKRLRIRGWLIVLSQILAVAYGIPFIFLLKNISVPGMRSILFNDYWIDALGSTGKKIFVGLVVLCIAEIFRLSTGLREERELTI